MSLTPEEQKLYQALYSRRVFTIAEVKQIFKKDYKAFTYAHRLMKKGYSARIKSGLYAIVPYEVAPDLKRIFQPDPKLVASKLVQPYFLSHHSALEIHGVANSIFHQAYVSSPKQFKKVVYQNCSYISLTTKHLFGMTPVNHYGLKINVSDQERTFLDCLRQLKYAGGLEEFLKSIMGLSSLNYQKLLKYLHQFNEQSLYAKTGYLLELFQKEFQVKSPVLAQLQKKIGKKTYYLERKGKQKFIKKWNLIVPANIKELIQGA